MGRVSSAAAMSGMGQNAKCATVSVMSASRPKSDMLNARRLLEKRAKRTGLPLGSDGGFTAATQADIGRRHLNSAAVLRWHRRVAGSASNRGERMHFLATRTARPSWRRCYGSPRAPNEFFAVVCHLLLLVRPAFAWGW